MKPFNLEEAKAGKPIVTRSGIPAVFLCINDACKTSNPIICVVYGDNGVREWGPSGNYLASNEESSRDLFMAPIKKEGWINIYSCSPSTLYPASNSCIYYSKEIADSYSSDQRIACVRIEWEE